MDASCGRGHDDVGDNPAGWQPAALRFCEGTGDISAVPQTVLHDKKRRGGPDELLRPQPDDVREDRAVGATYGGW